MRGNACKTCYDYIPFCVDAVKLYVMLSCCHFFGSTAGYILLDKEETAVRL